MTKKYAGSSFERLIFLSFGYNSDKRECIRGEFIESQREKDTRAIV